MKYKITLQGKTYEVLVEEGEAIIEDEYDVVVPVAPAAPAAVPTPAAAAPTAGPVAAGTTIDAPLPGNILSINVTVGQAVKAGDVLLIIEAMKMENEVSAPCDGMVKQIVTSKGAVVSTGDTLLVI